MYLKRGVDQNARTSEIKKGTRSPNPGYGQPATNEILFRQLRRTTKNNNKNRGKKTVPVRRINPEGAIFIRLAAGRRSWYRRVPVYNNIIVVYTDCDDGDGGGIGFRARGPRKPQSRKKATSRRPRNRPPETRGGRLVR